MHRHDALCLLKLGYTYQALGDYHAAAGYLRESLEIFGHLELAHFAERAREALQACHGPVSSPTASVSQPAGGAAWR
jgi:hypothetical protein